MYPDIVSYTLAVSHIVLYLYFVKRLIQKTRRFHKCTPAIQSLLHEFAERAAPIDYELNNGWIQEYHNWENNSANVEYMEGLAYELWEEIIAFRKRLRQAVRPRISKNKVR